MVSEQNYLKTSISGNESNYNLQTSWQDQKLSHNGFDLINQYSMKWNFYVLSLKTLGNYFEPLVATWNEMYQQIYDKQPQFPAFSLWRLGSQMWVREVYESDDLAQLMIQSFGQILTLRRNENINIQLQETIPDKQLKKQEYMNSPLHDTSNILPQLYLNQQYSYQDCQVVTDNQRGDKIQEDEIVKQGDRQQQQEDYQTKEMEMDLLEVHSDSQQFRKSDDSVSRTNQSDTNYISHHFQSLDFSHNFFSKNLFMIDTLLSSFVDSIIDISLNEMSVHFLGHNEHCVEKPFMDLEREIQNTSLKFYKHQEYLFGQDLVNYYQYLQSDLKYIGQFCQDRTLNVIQKLTISRWLELFDDKILNQYKEIKKQGTVEHVEEEKLNQFHECIQNCQLYERVISLFSQEKSNQFLSKHPYHNNTEKLEYRNGGSSSGPNSYFPDEDYLSREQSSNIEFEMQIEGDGDNQFDEDLPDPLIPMVRGISHVQTKNCEFDSIIDRDDAQNFGLYHQLQKQQFQSSEFSMEPQNTDTLSQNDLFRLFKQMKKDKHFLDWISQFDKVYKEKIQIENIPREKDLEIDELCDSRRLPRELSEQESAFFLLGGHVTFKILQECTINHLEENEKLKEDEEEDEEHRFSDDDNNQEKLEVYFSSSEQSQSQQNKEGLNSSDFSNLPQVKLKREFSAQYSRELESLGEIKLVKTKSFHSGTSNQKLDKPQYRKSYHQSKQQVMYKDKLDFLKDSLEFFLEAGENPVKEMNSNPDIQNIPSFDPIMIQAYKTVDYDKNGKGFKNFLILNEQRNQPNQESWYINQNEQDKKTIQSNYNKMQFQISVQQDQEFDDDMPLPILNLDQQLSGISFPQIETPNTIASQENHIKKNIFDSIGKLNFQSLNSEFNKIDPQK